MKRISVKLTCATIFGCVSLGVAPFAASQQSANANHPVAAIQDTETQAQRDARMAWWREARFGMFIHWGLYAVPAGVWNDRAIDGIGEWLMLTARVPVADYEALAAKFNPEKFDARAWVALAKAAGMKYIVFTAKHHDGFAMFDSKASPFNIVAATPFKRDPLKELAAEAQKQGIKLGFYYSQSQDWTTPGSAFQRGDLWDEAQRGDFAEYLHEKAIPQLKELLTNYQPYPVVVWFDTPTNKMTPTLASEIVALMRKYPNLIWNNRLGGGYPGDTETPEQYLPPQGFPGKDWETCMTINSTWGYKSRDTSFKSTSTLVRNLVDAASKGGNYLLNVGPDALGVIPEPEVVRLRAMGDWMRVNGESIYGTGPTPFNEAHGFFSSTDKDKDGKPVWNVAWDWRATSKGDKIYIHLFDYPARTFHVDHVAVTVKTAYLLADATRAPLKVTQQGGGLDIAVPNARRDPIDTVVVIESRR